jgi:hypothetical protein
VANPAPLARLRRALARRPRTPAATDGLAVSLRPIVARLDALETMVEGLQDCVDRQARRQDERLTELARQVEPGQLARALSDDARRRGL